MISNRELKYVNAKIDQEVPYPGDNYSKDALLELKNAIALYDTYYKGREYDVLFNNGENMEFEIAEHNLAHIIGINHNNLIQQGFIKELYGENITKTSYELLCDIADNVDDILKLNKLKKYSLINFYRLKTRSEVFSKFSNFNEFNFGCIYYDKDVAEKNSFSSHMKSEYDGYSYR